MRDKAICDGCEITEDMVKGKYFMQLPKKWESCQRMDLCPRCAKFYNKRYSGRVNDADKICNVEQARLGKEYEAKVEIIKQEFLMEVKRLKSND